MTNPNQPELPAPSAEQIDAVARAIFEDQCPLDHWDAPMDNEERDSWRDGAKKAIDAYAATHAASRPADGVREEIESILADAKAGGPPVGNDDCCLCCGSWTPIGNPEAHDHEDDCTAAAEWSHWDGRLNWQARLRALLAPAPTSAQAGDGIAPVPYEQHEREILKVIDERDHREGVIDRILDTVLGTDRHEWSSAYSFEDAINDVADRMVTLDMKAAKAAPTSTGPTAPAPPLTVEPQSALWPMA